jgi:hypothetical protein
MADVATDDMHFFGTTVAKGAVLPAGTTASVARSYRKKGATGPPVPVVLRAFTDRGTAYTTATAWPASQPSPIVRRLLRGRYLG